MPEKPLVVENLRAWYGESQVLHGIDLEVREGEVVTLLGRNGAGRTSTLKAILGLVDRRRGSIRVNGRQVIAMPTHRIAHVGQLGYCPEDRGIYARLSVDENLRLPRALAANNMTMTEIYRMFPQLARRRRSMGMQLSGGEQQILAIARILRTGARLLLLDEITEGLAPRNVQALADILRQLKDKGLTIVLVEQNFDFARALADRHYVVEHGQIAEVITGSEVGASRDRLNTYLSV